MNTERFELRRNKNLEISFSAAGGRWCRLCNLYIPDGCSVVGQGLDGETTSIHYPSSVKSSSGICEHCIEDLNIIQP